MKSAPVISAAVEQQGAATGEIAQSAQQAAGGTTEVNNAIGEVTTMSDETGKSAQHVQTAANDLSRQAGELRAQFDSFISQIRAG